MADAVSMSMGGRVASIYRQNVKRRRYTTVVNEIETKRLDFIKKQLENDRSIEFNKMQRYDPVIFFVYLNKLVKYLISNSVVNDLVRRVLAEVSEKNIIILTHFQTKNLN